MQRAAGFWWIIPNPFVTPAGYGTGLQFRYRASLAVFKSLMCRLRPDWRLPRPKGNRCSCKPHRLSLLCILFVPYILNSLRAVVSIGRLRLRLSNNGLTGEAIEWKALLANPI